MEQIVMNTIKKGSTKVEGYAKAAADIRQCEEMDNPPPVNGVLTVDLNSLSAAGIVFSCDDDRLSFWSNPNMETNEKFSQLTVDLVNAAGYDGVESHMMFNAINTMELNIRLIGVLQGKSHG